MSDFELLEKRIDGLERQNRWLKCVGVLATAVVAASVFIAAARQQPNELRASSLEIVAPNGKTAIKIHAPSGTSVIDLWDTTSKSMTPQVSIGCIPRESGGGTQLFMRGSMGQNAVNIVGQNKGSVRTW